MKWKDKVFERTMKMNINTQPNNVHLFSCTMHDHLPSDASAGMRNCNTKIRQRPAPVVHANTHRVLTVSGDLVLVSNRVNWN